MTKYPDVPAPAGPGATGKTLPDLWARLVGAVGPRRAGDLPSRLVERIRSREDEAEVLVRVIQLCIILVFAALYAVSPKTGSTMMQAFTPTVITLYFGVTVFGLVWSLRARLPDWAVYWSTVMDMGLLFTMIWSFHIQYEQPAAFYLKAPTLLYVFIFIAVRALRFQARFVVAAGLAGAAGWIGLVVYAASAGPGPAPITRDYVAYLTGNYVLVGGEVDKIVSILLVTAVLALALRRARATLVDSVREATAAEDLSRFVDAPVAERIRHAGREVGIGGGVTRRIAVVNVDMRGFTSFAATLPPDEAMALLAEYQARFVPVVRAHGGIIDKFLGDGIMATFGAVEPDEGAAAKALAALDDIAKEARAWSAGREAAGLTPIAVNAAAAAGDAVCGAVGHGTRLEYTVIGAAVNLCAKLEKANKTFGTVALTDAATLAFAEAAGYRPPAGYERIRGRVDGIDGCCDLVALAR